MMRRRTLLSLPFMLTACTTPLALPDGEHALTLDVPGHAPARLWLHLPPGYAAGGTRWPLVFFLHGSGERGTDLAAVKVHGPPKHALQRRYPFVLASPQLDEGRRWDPAALHALLGVLKARLAIDDARVVATGLSLGGMGCWDWAAAHPRDLAAIAPVCGFGDPAAACALRAVPVRAYHGDADTVVPLAAQQASVDALRACGGQADFIVYTGVGHDAWNPAYDDPALVPWMLARRRAA